MSSAGGGEPTATSGAAWWVGGSYFRFSIIVTFFVVSFLKFWYRKRTKTATPSPVADHTPLMI